MPLTVAAVLAVGLVGFVAVRHGAQQAVLLGLGLGLGAALFHSRFGFTSAWRQLVAVGNGSGLRAHTLLLGTTATLFALVLAGMHVALRLVFTDVPPAMDLVRYHVATVISYPVAALAAGVALRRRRADRGGLT